MIEKNIPDYDDGWSKEDYEQAVEWIVSVAEDVDEQPLLAIDDVVGNLRLFGLNEFYGETYRDIEDHHEIKDNEKHIARVDESKTSKHNLQERAGEILAIDAQQRYLERQKKE